MQLWTSDCHFHQLLQAYFFSFAIFFSEIPTHIVIIAHLLFKVRELLGNSVPWSRVIFIYYYTLVFKIAYLCKYDSSVKCASENRFQLKLR